MTTSPYKLEDAPHPGVIRKGNVIFFAHELDKMYYIHGARLHRDLFAKRAEAGAQEADGRSLIVQWQIPETRFQSIRQCYNLEA